MKKHYYLALMAGLLLPSALHAQHISPEMLHEIQTRKVVVDPSYAKLRKAKAGEQRPDHVDNSQTIYFPPVFNQHSESCEQASKIGYLFTYELNAWRRADGSKAENQLATMFSWYNYFSGSGAPELAVATGIPNSVTYGGRLYSKQLGGHGHWKNAESGWMTGYEKWYAAMFNRASRVVSFPLTLRSEEGREAAKQFLWNHSGDGSLPSGGVIGIGLAAIGMNVQDIPDTEANKAAGVAGMKYIRHWGPSFDHAMAIVGYDDRLEFDLDDNGVFGEKDKDEVGAWILVNSWGNWANGGFVYCPYKYGVLWCTEDGQVPTEGVSWASDPYWTPTIYEVRKDYRPLRTIKLLMDYTHRSELLLGAGVSADITATQPERAITFKHFNYCGDGRGGDSVPTPEVPMLGRWADGKLHGEPMEFGYDLTDLTEQFDPALPLKYFFTIETKKDVSRGSGTLHAASIIDYALDRQGVEVPFDLGAEGVSIQNNGAITVVSVVVPGRGLYAPQNVVAADGVLSWQAPMASGNTLTGYRVTDAAGQSTMLGANTTFITLPQSSVATQYSIAAMYGSNASHPVNVSVPAGDSKDQYIDFTQGGFTVPAVFGAKYDEATIEFWVNPNSLKDWNQSAGPGWGTFMFHANANGTFTAGWATGAERLEVANALSTDKWTHIAITVKKNMLSVYVNGVRKGSITSQKYSGIGGFGNLTFRNDGNNAQDAKYDEIRIWSRARTATELLKGYRQEMGEAAQPEGLLAYYKGDLITVAGQPMLRDHSGNGFHATLTDTNYACTDGAPDKLEPATDLGQVTINTPATEVYAGIPVTLSANPPAGATKLLWTATDAGITNLEALRPALTFRTPGQQTVSVSATNGTESVSAQATITVLPAPAPDATFTVAATTIAASDHVSFLISKPMAGYTYHWAMPGADIEEARTPNAAATYNNKGTYTVTLTVTAPDGRQASHSETITVSESAPLAAFSVEPAIVMKGEMTRLTDQSKYAPVSRQWQLLSPVAAMSGEGEVLAFKPTKPGIYTVTLTATNESGTSTATEEGALIVCNADSRNGLTFTSDKAHIELTDTPLAQGLKAFTIEWWMNASTPTPACNGIGQDKSTLLLTTNGKGEMALSAGGSTAASGDGYVITGSWHHYAVDFYNGTVRFHRDGEQIATATLTTKALPAMTTFRIGTDEAPMKAQIDEFRIWGKRLTATALKGYINQPIDDVATAENTNQLLLYYNFNQNGGDVQDATTNANTGRRVGFGPDGDAWGLSRGVFCLNFDDKVTNITSKHLSNYRAPFANTGKEVNPSVPGRFLGLKSWTLENTGNNGTGAHVDTQKDNYLTVTTEWDGFDATLADHKVYQTITLPAGAYTLTTNFGGEHQGQAEGNYLVVAEGTTLPNTADLDREALAYTAMQPQEVTLTNAVSFILGEETQVSLGLLCNMSGKQCMVTKSFTLTQLAYEPIENDPDGITSLPQTDKRRDAAIYDLAGNRILTPRKGGIYIINGQKVMTK